MSVILKELEKRQKQIDEYEAKVEKLEALKAEVACLEKEVTETNTFELKDEIKELTNCAIQLGLIEAETTDEEKEEVGEEQAPVDNVERATNILTSL